MQKVQAVDQLADLVILDLGLPDLDGQEVLRRLREWLTAPIIILSARDQEPQKVQALDHGADDYFTKPFGVGELLARIRTATPLEYKLLVTMLKHAGQSFDASIPAARSGGI